MNRRPIAKKVAPLAAALVAVTAGAAGIASAATTGTTYSYTGTISSGAKDQAVKVTGPATISARLTWTGKANLDLGLHTTTKWLQSSNTYTSIKGWTAGGLSENLSFFVNTAGTYSVKVIDRWGSSGYSLKVTVTPKSGTAPAPAPAPAPSPSPAPAPAPSPSPAPAPAPAPVPVPDAGVDGSPLLPVGGVFGHSSIWGLDVSQAPLAANSAQQAANLALQVSEVYNGTAGFNAYSYTTAYTTVPAGTPRADVKFYDCQHKGFTPTVLTDPAKGGVFLQVPIPDNAVPAPGTDSSLSIWDPSSDQLWELWKASKHTDGWYACWGGRIDNASLNGGVFPGNTGVSATSLAYAGGTLGIREVQAGHIDHAIALQLRRAASYKTFSYPAQRSDGAELFGTLNAIEEGARLRLDPSINVDAMALTPVAKMVAKAAQKYGFIVTDKGGAVAVVGEDGSAITRATGTNPWTTLLGGKPAYSVLTGFPWSRVQVLPHDYGR